jgi:hypothetical protein
LDEAERHAHQAREIRERLGLNNIWANYAVLADIARARGDAAQAAGWDRKRDAVLEELDRRSRGPGGLPPQFLQAVQQLAIACAQASVAGAELAPDVESALAQLDQLPAPLPDLSAFFRATAAGQFPRVPAAIPPELAEFLTQLQSAVREARPTA